MNGRTVTICQLLSLVVIAGCSKDLSRGFATDRIKSDKNFNETLDLRVPVGRFWYNWRYIKDDDKWALQALGAAGVLELRETGKVYAVWWKEYVAELTPTGQTAAKAWDKTSEKVESTYAPASPDATVYRIPIAERRLVEVTGIASEPSGKESHVEFSWKWTATPQAKLLPKKVPSDEIHRGAAQFQLYDDGWRLVGLSL
jgi:hypothetical protein